MRSDATEGSFQRLIYFLVFCGVFMEAATWFVECRLNEIKERLKFSRRLLTLRKKDVASLGSWTFFVELLEKDNKQIEKDEDDEDNPSMPFWKLEILSGSYMPQFCLRVKNLPRNLSRAAAGMFITLKFQSTCCSQNRSNFLPSYFAFFIRSDDLSAAMKSDHLVLDSSCLRRACLSLFFACLPPKLLETNSKVRDICCWMLFFHYNCELCL